jgi:hypothetical protein
MRLVLQIFATIFLVSLIVGGLLMVGIDYTRAGQIEELSAALPADMQGLITAADAEQWRLAGTIWAVLAGGCSVGILAVWLRKRLFGIVTGGVLAVLTVGVAYLQPAAKESANAMESVGTNVALFGGIGVVILILLHTMVKE